MAVINLLKEHNIVFIHIPKNGGSSIRRGFFNNNFERRVDSIFPEEWDNLFKFTFVRNPFDRFISAYKMFTEGFIKGEKNINWEKYEPMSMLDFLEVAKKDINYFDTSGIGFHTYPQNHKFNHLDCADFVGRFENLEEDFRTICEINGIEYKKLPHWNKTDRSNYRDYYDEHTLNEVSEYYSEDLKKLGYSF